MNERKFLHSLFKRNLTAKERREIYERWLLKQGRSESPDYRLVRMRTWIRQNREHQYLYRQKRQSRHNYIDTYLHGKPWDQARVKTMARLIEKRIVDVVVASKLRTSIPMVYYFRRKFGIIRKYWPKVQTDSREFVDLLSRSEASLKKMVKK